ncbi:MAG TPA: hypothetical protein VH723_06325 [Candidatus Limnocylindrales bacterium]|jgi:hypothetical protein
MTNQEIPVRRREGTPWWMWLIGLLLLALIAWWLLNNMNQGQVGGEVSPSNAPSMQMSPESSGSPEASAPPAS